MSIHVRHYNRHSRRPFFCFTCALRTAISLAIIFGVFDPVDEETLQFRPNVVSEYEVFHVHVLAGALKTAYTEITYKYSET